MNEIVAMRCNNVSCRVVEFRGVFALPPLNTCPVCLFQGVVL